MKGSLLLFSIAPLSVVGLSGGSGEKVDVSSSLSRSRLVQAFSSPSGKLTFSAEVVLPEPTDPTAILLQSNALRGLSSKIRAAKTNAVFLEGSLSALKSFSAEQESARKSFPGPVPVVYCGGGGDDVKLMAVAAAGAEGLLVRVLSDNNSDQGIGGLVDLHSDSSLWVLKCREALNCGLQPIPEVVIRNAAVKTWDGDQVTSVVEKLSELMGFEPVAVVLTVQPPDHHKDSDGENEAQINLPSVPKSLNRKIPIIGSVSTPAGDGRLVAEANRFKAAGFIGALLRKKCIPGFRIQLNLETVGNFWAGCITDLKSTRSRSFSFRSRNNMEKSAASTWGNYQKSVIESGALGDPNESHSVLNEAAGEYKGFA